MLATLLTATVLAFCNAQVDPKDRTFPFYGYNPNPGSFLYEDVDSGLQLTYNLTENGNMMYGIECQQSFEAGPFRFPCISKVPPDFINFVIDIDSIDVLYNGSRTACPSLDFAEGDLEEFSFNSPDRDSGRALTAAAYAAWESAADPTSFSTSLEQGHWKSVALMGEVVTRQLSLARTRCPRRGPESPTISTSEEVASPSLRGRVRYVGSASRWAIQTSKPQVSTTVSLIIYLDVIPTPVEA